MFFSFISYYTIALIFPTVIGTPIFILQLIDGKTGWLYSISTIVYTAAMILWSTVFYEMWKWKEKLNAIEWGQLDFEEEEITRAQYKGV